MYFGFGLPEDKEAAIKLYDECASLDNKRAILALAAIHEVTSPRKSF